MGVPTPVPNDLHHPGVVKNLYHAEWTAFCLQEAQAEVQQHKGQWDQLVGRATDLESALEQWQAAYTDLQQQLDTSQVG